MSRHLTISRRGFLNGTAAAAGLTAAGWRRMMRAGSPAETIRVGVIGTGVRGKYLIGNLPEPFRVVAVCDCAAARIGETLEPRDPFRQVLAAFCTRDAAGCRTYLDYRQMLDRESLEGVIIATPDHHHAQAAMLALQAGLDVYLEKPFALTIREGRLLADLVTSSGRILQVGSQQRTMEVNRYACELIRSG